MVIKKNGDQKAIHLPIRPSLQTNLINSIFFFPFSTFFVHYIIMNNLKSEKKTNISCFLVFLFHYIFFQWRLEELKSKQQQPIIDDDDESTDQQNGQSES